MVETAHYFSESENFILILLFMDNLKLYSRSENILDSLNQIICAFDKNIGLEFEIEKCNILVIKKDKTLNTVGIVLTYVKVTDSSQEGKSYKHHETLEANKFLVAEMKFNVSKEYFR